MNKTTLKKILTNHKKWLNSSSTGQRANLRGVDLYGVDLQGANLQGADLHCANLSSADLSSASLRDVDLQGADLQGANLQGADLRGADLRDADLRYANLTCANLTRANLTRADLRYANLLSADLTRAILPDFTVCPEKGSFVAYKKLYNGVIAELQIPASAKRTSSLVGRKCRANQAKVIKFLNSKKLKVPSSYDLSFVYEVGKTVSVKTFDDDIRVECTSGIHFFITKKEAEEY